MFNIFFLKLPFVRYVEINCTARQAIHYDIIWCMRFACRVYIRTLVILNPYFFSTATMEIRKHFFHDIEEILVPGKHVGKSP
jgi:hypothetical protein